MTDATPRSRPNRATRYEVTATRPDGRTAVVGYTIHKSRPGLLRMLRSRADEIIAFCAIGPDDLITWHASPRAHAKVSGCAIGFTGRTERDVLMGAIQ